MVLLAKTNLKAEINYEPRKGKRYGLQRECMLSEITKISLLPLLLHLQMEIHSFYTDNYEAISNDIKYK